MKIYMAPMEGVTDYTYRNAFEKYYGGIDKYYTPFIQPNQTKNFKSREKNEIDPAKQKVGCLVPQLLTNNAEHFIWATDVIAAKGYSEINLNLGCPSGTVTAKKRGSGFLAYPDELDRFFDEVFTGLAHTEHGKHTQISVKTRLGMDDPEEFSRILEIYNKYPICELTIHPRIRKDFYEHEIRESYFRYAYENSRIPLVFNGELKSESDICAKFSAYPEMTAVMLGRGMLIRPELAALAKGAQDDRFSPVGSFSGSAARFKEFHDEIFYECREKLSGDVPLIHRMKEYWAFWQFRFPDSSREIKRLQKAKHADEYLDCVSAVMTTKKSAI